MRRHNLTRRCFDQGFTLIELLIVISIIMILAGLLVNIGNYVQDKAKRSRAQSEIASFETALESYKTDNGWYPIADLNGTPATFPDPVSPPNRFDNTYISGATILYQGLSGKLNTDTQATGKVYIDFRANQIDPKTKNYVIDPWRHPYGYSYEQSTNSTAAFYDGPSASKSHNTNFVDLWSTAGTDPKTGEPNPPQKWVANWSN